MRKALLAALLMAAVIVFGGCGRKAPPRWVEPSQPLPPQALNAIARPDSITLYWLPSQKIEGVTIKGYAVFRAGDGGKFEEIGFVNSGYYPDATVAPGVRYGYRVIARPVGDGLESKPVSISASASSGIEPPQNLKVSVERTGIVLVWDIAPNASGYRVYKSHVMEEQSTTPVGSELVTTGEFRAMAEPELTVYYHLRAVHDDGAVVSESQRSDMAAVTPAMFMPSAVKGVNAVRSEQKVLVFWDESPETWVSGYRVFRAVGDSGVFEPIGDARTLALPDNNPPAGKLRYRVSALVGVHDGPPSAEAVVIVGAQGR